MARTGFLATAAAVAWLGLAVATLAAPVRIGLIPSHPGEYADGLLAGAQQAAKGLGGESEATVSLFLPATADAAGQGEALMKAVSVGCSGVILSSPGTEARGAAFLGKIEGAYRGGCPGIVIDAPLSSPYIAAFVGTGFYQAGQETGAFIGKRIGGAGGILIVGDAKASLGVTQFVKGLVEGFRLYPDAIPVTSGDLAQTLPSVPPSEVAPTLKRLGGRVAALCIADPDAWPEVARILAGMAFGPTSPRPAILVYGNRKDTLDALRSGTIDAVTADCPYLVGYYAMRSAVDAARGKPVAAQRNVATKIITADKLADPKVAEFLDPSTSSTAPANDRPAKPVFLEQ